MVSVDNCFTEPTDFDKRFWMKVDSRANTICAGSAFQLLEAMDQETDVSRFHDLLRTMSHVPIGTLAMAYDHPGLQETVILIFPQSLYFGKSMEHSLLSPNQLQMNGLVMDTCLRQFSTGESIHGIYDPTEDLYFQFQMHGCISFLPTWLLTNGELEKCCYLYMTSESEWEPYSNIFQEVDHPFQGMHVASVKLGEHHNMAGRSISAVTLDDKSSKVGPDELARWFGIMKDWAAMTLKVTMQWGIRQFSKLANRRFQMQQSHLWYPHLQMKLYLDTLFLKTKSLMGEMCGQMMMTDGHKTVYPMKLKLEAGLKLNQWIVDNGIPGLLITDNAWEETYRTWGKVTKKYLIPQKWTKPGSPWQNRAEVHIGEWKKHYHCLMNHYCVLESLWNFGAIYISDVQQVTLLAELGNWMPYEVLKHDMPDILDLLNFDFYQWVKF